MVSKRAHHVLCLKDGVIQCQGPTAILNGQSLQNIFGSETGLFSHHHV